MPLRCAATSSANNEIGRSANNGLITSSPKHSCCHVTCFTHMRALAVRQGNFTTLSIHALVTSMTPVVTRASTHVLQRCYRSRPPAQTSASQGFHGHGFSHKQCPVTCARHAYVGTAAPVVTSDWSRQSMSAHLRCGRCPPVSGVMIHLFWSLVQCPRHAFCRPDAEP